MTAAGSIAYAAQLVEAAASDTSGRDIGELRDILQQLAELNAAARRAAAAAGAKIPALPFSNHARVQLAAADEHFRSVALDLGNVIEALNPDTD